MRLNAHHVVAEVDGTEITTPITGATIRLGPLELSISDPDADELTWSVANRGDRAVRVRSVALIHQLEASGAVRIWRHGYQSWSPCGSATFGVDRDPSTTPGSVRIVHGAYHADQRPTRPGELRSEWCTVLRDATGPPVLVGFTDGSRHDGILRLRPALDGSPELWVEAFLGDAALDPGDVRQLHDVVVLEGDRAEELLVSWADRVASRTAPRRSGPHRTGWCSWYQYFHGVTETDLRSNLARASAGSWPFQVFQLDDGYQPTIGDWLRTNDRFPSSLEALAGAIGDEGFEPGLWLAPFLVAPDAPIARHHPDWLARGHNGEPLVTWYNPDWEGGRDGRMWGLDPTHPAVLEHLRSVAAALRQAGYAVLKLDFTFAPSFDGRWHDPRATPAERVRAGYQAIRDGAGDEVFLLGCGVPLANVVGLVDANRIGQDVAPTWSLRPDEEVVPGYLDIQPATRHAYGNTISRSFLHRRLWINDPDCIMLRTADTQLSVEAARSWAEAAALSGGMVLLSDDLALLDAEAQARFDDVVSASREADARARAGSTALAEGLLDQPVPTTLLAGDRRLVIDPATGRAR